MICEERKLVWKGAIPMQLQLHNSEVTTVPPPSNFLMLAPRNGYLPLLLPYIKPHFQSALPIGQDTGWFEYEGLPLKWHVPTGVLYDLLCFEPARPWNLMASYVIHGSTKHVMNLSQMEQAELWRSVVEGDIESYERACIKLAPSVSTNSASVKADEMNIVKVPFRLYMRRVEVNDKGFSEAHPLKHWDHITYISRPVEIKREDGDTVTLWEALQNIAPQLFVCASELQGRDHTLPAPLVWESESSSAVATESAETDYSRYPKIIPITHYMWGQKTYFVNGLIRIQGIEPNPRLPVDWIARNLSAPDYFVHVCILIATNHKDSSAQ